MSSSVIEIRDLRKVFDGRAAVDGLERPRLVQGQPFARRSRFFRIEQILEPLRTFGIAYLCQLFEIGARGVVKRMGGSQNATFATACPRCAIAFCLVGRDPCPEGPCATNFAPEGRFSIVWMVAKRATPPRRITATLGEASLGFNLRKAGLIGVVISAISCHFPQVSTCEHIPAGFFNVHFAIMLPRRRFEKRA